MIMAETTPLQYHFRHPTPRADSPSLLRLMNSPYHEEAGRLPFER
jgi:hypothetical protein